MKNLILTAACLLASLAFAMPQARAFHFLGLDMGEVGAAPYPILVGAHSYGGYAGYNGEAYGHPFSTRIYPTYFPRQRVARPAPAHPEAEAPAKVAKTKIVPAPKKKARRDRAER